MSENRAAPGGTPQRLADLLAEAMQIWDLDDDGDPLLVEATENDWELASFLAAYVQRAERARPLEDHEPSRSTAGEVRQMADEFETLLSVCQQIRAGWLPHRVGEAGWYWGRPEEADGFRQWSEGGDVPAMCVIRAMTAEEVAVWTTSLHPLAPETCSCTPEGGCDEEGDPGCAFCKALDGEEPCPAEAVAASIGDDAVQFVTRPNSTVVETHVPDCAGWNRDFMPCRGQCIEREFA